MRRPFISQRRIHFWRFHAETRRCSVAKRRRKRGVSAKGSSNHGNDHNFNDESRTISSFLRQERSSRTTKERDGRREANVGCEPKGSGAKEGKATERRAGLENKWSATRQQGSNYIRQYLITYIRVLRTFKSLSVK